MNKQSYGKMINIRYTDKHNKNSTPEQKTKDNALLNKAFGMLIVKPENIPQGSLFDFDVADHITLFDEADDTR